MNFASVRSNNEAAGTEAICILGSPHPGDDVLERWGALMGIGVERVGDTRGTEVCYEPSVGNDIYGHFVLDKVEQSIMRGRRGDGDDTGSTVVIGTGCLPNWLRDVDVDVTLDIKDDSPFGSEERRKIIRYLEDEGEGTSRELDEMTEFSGQGRRKLINQLEGKGWLTSEPQPGPKPTRYIWEGPCQ